MNKVTTEYDINPSETLSLPHILQFLNFCSIKNSLEKEEGNPPSAAWGMIVEIHRYNNDYLLGTKNLLDRNIPRLRKSETWKKCSSCKYFWTWLAKIIPKELRRRKLLEKKQEPFPKSFQKSIFQEMETSLTKRDGSCSGIGWTITWDAERYDAEFWQMLRIAIETNLPLIENTHRYKNNPQTEKLWSTLLELATQNQTNKHK